jgi:hypothetical protein
MPTYPFGTCAEKGLGFPATKHEIQRFGEGCRRVVRINPKTVDNRSFVEVAVMDRG